MYEFYRTNSRGFFPCMRSCMQFCEREVGLGGRVSRTDICIDDNHRVTCILRRLLMGEICFAIAFQRFCSISNFTEFVFAPSLSLSLSLSLVLFRSSCRTTTAFPCSWKPDRTTIKYPSQLFRPSLSVQ